jgi:drug/metabolite transporter superfamily protein YnfA
MTMELLKVSLLFAITAVAEIVGRYLPWLVLRQDKRRGCSFRQRWRWPCSHGC